MKNVFKSALVVLSLCTGFGMEAAEDLDVKVLDNQNVKVEFHNTNEGDFLLLKDPFGEVLFKDSIGIRKSYQKTFNLELVPNGFYFLTLDQNGSLLVATIKKTDNGLEIEESPEFIFKPCYKTDKRQVKLFINNPRKLNAEIKILDSNGILVGKFESRELLVQKTLDFSRVSSGSYSVEVEIDEQKFLKTLKIS